MANPASKDQSSLSLPSPPQALAAIVQEAAKPDASVPTLAKLCSSDPSLSVELLRLVNSPVYRRGGMVSSVNRAVQVLGIRSLRNVALCTAARSCSSAKKLRPFELDRFWEDSLRRAVAAQILAERSGGDIEPTEAFTAGLLQDLGVLALVQSFPDRVTGWNECVGATPARRRQREHELYGVTHDALGADLAATWELPPELAMPLLHHHAPGEAPEQWRQRCELAGHAELLASVLASEDKRGALDEARQALTAAYGMEPTAVDGLVGELGERVERVAGALGIRVGAQPTLESVLRQANLGLIEMNLSYEDLVQKLEKTLAEKDELTRELGLRNRELEQLSITDTLTSLPNRRAFSGRLSYEIGRTARSGGSLVLLIGDIDKFKSVNDTWGHEYGDQVLKAVAVHLGNGVRQTDMVARIGGEEFAMVLPGTDRAGGMIAAKKLLTALRENVMTTPTGERRAFTISLGMSVLEGPNQGRFDVDEVSVRMYKASDAALYASKKQGRDRVTEVREVVPWTTKQG